MPKVGGRRKKARSHKDIDAELEKELPRVFVIKKGDVSAQMQQTVQDMRKCFYPNTSMKLQDNNKLKLKTYIKASKYYNVTHLVALQQRREKNFMRVIKIGGGEMNFRIINYCRMKDVLHEGGQPFSFSFKDPLVILNNFNENGQVRMIGRGLQQMFPPINPQKIKLQRLKRVIFFSYAPTKKMIYFRHYKIVIHEGGINSSFAKLLEQKPLDLSHFKSIGEYLSSLHSEGETVGSESQQKVKLVEMGPRMKLKFLSYKESSKSQAQHDENQGEEQIHLQGGQQEHEGGQNQNEE